MVTTVQDSSAHVVRGPATTAPPPRLPFSASYVTVSFGVTKETGFERLPFCTTVNS